MDPETGTILELDRVMIKPAWPYNTALTDVSLTLNPSELALVIPVSNHACPLIADIAQGLVEPIGGAVRFLGQLWSALTIEDLARHRGLIGRVFATTAWVSNLDLDENILLGQRHHSNHSGTELRRQALDLARRFGLKSLPQKRPGIASLRELKLSQWVRALLGEKRLIILEQPSADLSPEAMPTLLETLMMVRSNGAAVLWISADPSEYQHPALTADYCYRMRGLRLIRETTHQGGIHG